VRGVGSCRVVCIYSSVLAAQQPEFGLWGEEKDASEAGSAGSHMRLNNLFHHNLHVAMQMRLVDATLLCSMARTMFCSDKVAWYTCGQRCTAASSL
jgi:hypothetical protein